MSKDEKTDSGLARSQTDGMAVQPRAYVENDATGNPAIFRQSTEGHVHGVG